MVCVVQKCVSELFRKKKACNTNISCCALWLSDDFQMAIGAQTCFIWGPRRETSAKAFGTLANALPEEMLGDLADAISMHCDLQVYSYSTEPISDDESI